MNSFFANKFDHLDEINKLLENCKLLIQDVIEN